MPFVNDTANASTVTNDSQAESGTLTFADMTTPWSDAEGTWGSPRTPWTRDSANASTPINDVANA